jgi:hypothetical protein
VEWFAAAVVLACLLGLLAVVSRRWGPRRFYVGARGAAWLVVIVMALVVVRLILD